MLKKMRWHFILAAMTAVFIMLVLLVTGINVWNFYTTAKRADQRIQEIYMFESENNEKNSESSMFAGDFPKSSAKGENTLERENISTEDIPAGPPAIFDHPEDRDPEAPYTTRFFIVKLNQDKTVTDVSTDYIASVTKEEAAFFPKYGAFVMIALYFGGILMGILMALLFGKTIFKGEAVPFVMELPNYRLPGAKNVGQLLWEKAKDFLQRAFTVIFVATIVIWFLQTFDLQMNIVTDSRDSILAVVAGIVAPVFKPLGFGDWRFSTALVTGFMAKESVVSTLSILFGSTGALVEVLTPLAAVSLLTFCLLYTPCVAAIASVKRELGGKWAAGVVIGQCVIAWIAAFLVKIIGVFIGF